MDDTEQLLIGADRILDFPGNLTFVGDRQAPNTGEKAVDTLHSLHLPWLHLFERAHEHLIKSQRVGSVFLHDIVGIDHVASGLGHLLPVLAHDQPLVDEFLERFGRANVAEIEKHLVPETGVEQVEHRVLGSADVEVDHPRLLIRPVFLGFLRDKSVGITRIAVAKIVPAGSRPLRHGVGLAGHAIRQLHPLLRFRQDRLWRTRRLVVLQWRREQRQILVGNREMLPILPKDRKRLAPVALAREKPVAELVLDLAVPLLVFDEPMNHR